MNTELNDDQFRDKILTMLRTGNVEVEFTKKDGTERVMNCTLEPSKLPPIVVKEDKKIRKESNTSMRVFDLDKQEWRSFTIRSVKKIKTTIGEDND